MIAVLNRKGQLTIPVEIRRAAGLEPGDRVAVDIVDGIVTIQPQPTDEEPDEDPAIFWGPNWREELQLAIDDVEAGRTTIHLSTEEFFAALDAAANADS